MLNQNATIGFVIWGVRNGFEVMLASNPSETQLLKADVISDNMRQVCNATSESFYSIHRNQQFGVVTIYHCDAKDMVGRKAYVAITLYIPSSYRFVGDVYNVLNQLKNFYVQKQGGAQVNMFTADMFAQQFRSLGCEKYNGFVIPGRQKGYYKFSAPNELKERFQLLDIHGYQAAFFIPSSVTGPEAQLSGCQPIHEFKDTVRVIIEGFDGSRYKILYKGQSIDASQNRFALEVKPGDELIFVDSIAGRSQSFSRFTPDQTINVLALFPNTIPDVPRPMGPPQIPTPPRGPDWRKILIWSLSSLASIAIIFIVLVEGEIIGDPFPPPKIHSDGYGNGNKGGDVNDGADAKKIWPKLNALKTYKYEVEGLYGKEKLSAADTIKIKGILLKQKGIKGVAFPDSMKSIDVSYDASEIDSVYILLKKIKVIPEKPSKPQPKAGNGSKPIKDNTPQVPTSRYKS